MNPSFVLVLAFVAAAAAYVPYHSYGVTPYYESGVYDYPIQSSHFYNYFPYLFGKNYETGYYPYSYSHYGYPYHYQQGYGYPYYLSKYFGNYFNNYYSRYFYPQNYEYGYQYGKGFPFYNFYQYAKFPYYSNRFSYY